MIDRPGFGRPHHKTAHPRTPRCAVHDKRLDNDLGWFVQCGTRIQMTQRDDAPSVFGDEYGMIACFGHNGKASRELSSAQRISELREQFLRCRDIVGGHRPDGHHRVTIYERPWMLHPRRWSGNRERLKWLVQTPRPIGMLALWDPLLV